MEIDRDTEEWVNPMVTERDVVGGHVRANGRCDADGG